MTAKGKIQQSTSWEVCFPRKSKTNPTSSQVNEYVIFISSSPGSSCSWLPGQRRPCGVLYKWPNGIPDQTTTEHCCTWLCSMRKPRIYWKSFIMVRCFLCLVSEANKRNIKGVWRMGVSLSSPWRGFQSLIMKWTSYIYRYYLLWYTFNTYIWLGPIDVDCCLIGRDLHLNHMTLPLPRPLITEPQVGTWPKEMKFIDWWLIYGADRFHLVEAWIVNYRELGPLIEDTSRQTKKRPGGYRLNLMLSPGAHVSGITSEWRATTLLLKATRHLKELP